MNTAKPIDNLEAICATAETLWTVQNLEALFRAYVFDMVNFPTQVQSVAPKPESVRWFAAFKNGVMTSAVADRVRIFEAEMRGFPGYADTPAMTAAATASASDYGAMLTRNPTVQRQVQPNLLQGLSASRQAVARLREGLRDSAFRAMLEPALDALPAPVTADVGLVKSALENLRDLTQEAEFHAFTGQTKNTWSMTLRACGQQNQDAFGRWDAQPLRARLAQFRHVADLHDTVRPRLDDTFSRYYDLVVAEFGQVMRYELVAPQTFAFANGGADWFLEGMNRA